MSLSIQYTYVSMNIKWWRRKNEEKSIFTTTKTGKIYWERKDKSIIYNIYIPFNDPLHIHFYGPTVQEQKYTKHKPEKHKKPNKHTLKIADIDTLISKWWWYTPTENKKQKYTRTIQPYKFAKANKVKENILKDGEMLCIKH